MAPRRTRNSSHAPTEQKDTGKTKAVPPSKSTSSSQSKTSSASRSKTSSASLAKPPSTSFSKRSSALPSKLSSASAPPSRSSSTTSTTEKRKPTDAGDYLKTVEAKRSKTAQVPVLDLSSSPVLPRVELDDEEQKYRKTLAAGKNSPHAATKFELEGIEHDGEGFIPDPNPMAGILFDDEEEHADNYMDDLEDEMYNEFELGNTSDEEPDRMQVINKNHGAKAAAERRIPGKVRFEDLPDGVGKQATRLCTCTVYAFPDELQTWNYLKDAMSNVKSEYLQKAFDAASSNDYVKRLLCRLMSYAAGELRYHLKNISKLTITDFYKLTAYEAEEEPARVYDENKPFQSALLPKVLRVLVDQPVSSKLEKRVLDSMRQDKRVPRPLLALLCTCIYNVLAEIQSGSNANFSSKNCLNEYQGVLKTMEDLDKVEPDYLKKLEKHIYHQAWDLSGDFLPDQQGKWFDGIQVQQYDAAKIKAAVGDIPTYD
ncbi:hypothetical protein K435DRAFT_813183 [Dendrothele bispora CBS 962.96]|uniref:DUF6532 domain-containing protein n=1 Tax=Dendrothele bispora (strain CBS 962.96) TaxID=1314807 RepID=A0A4S8KM82_DENBC|nr:hypothetical protein K435DRAFT_813183 [Dendrothele bispora CBS 962.96]